jgi:hypothetical protein
MEVVSGQWRCVRGTARGVRRAKLWTLEENHPQRFYEKRVWTVTEATRAVPFPPNPIDVQHAKRLERGVGDS